MRNKGRLLVLAPSVCDRRVVVICLTLTTSKPRLTNPSEISSAGVLRGRGCVWFFHGFLVVDVVAFVLGTFAVLCVTFADTWCVRLSNSSSKRSGRLCARTVTLLDHSLVV
jgi:hypothetical protein